MARGDGDKQIFVCKDDHESFLYWLERAYTSHCWGMHAWVLMGNHFHLLLETPAANLVTGTRMLLGTFGKAWNIWWRVKEPQTRTMSNVWRNTST